ncbi:tetratricopeptide repeat protein [Roseibium salinum]|nr:tetratricopeptide repeat protein [Roseibium salinum]
MARAILRPALKCSKTWRRQAIRNQPTGLAIMPAPKGLFFPTIPSARSPGLKKAARLGSVEALNAIGILHEQGLLAESSPETAYRYLLQAAEQGHVGAMGSVGWHLKKTGWGVRKDVFAAESWYLKSLDAGDSWAELNLAMLYVEGARSFSADQLQDAIAILNVHAERGDGYALMTLGRAYAEGGGVATDPEKGIVLFPRGGSGPAHGRAHRAW